MTRHKLSSHKTYEEAKKAYNKNDVQDNLQIRRVSGGFNLVRRTRPQEKAHDASAPAE